MAWFCSGLLLGLLIYGLVRLIHHHNRHTSPSDAVTGSQLNWDEVSNLDRYDSNKLRAFISPLASISNNAYAVSSPRPVSNWKLSSRVQPLIPSSGAGAQAVLYEEVNSKRLIVAFRGTTTEADTCVDSIFFGSVPFMSLPTTAQCLTKFTNVTLDYISQAVNYTATILQVYHGVPLLLSGHSLGAALAVLVSASFAKLNQDIPVVAFSSPGTRNVLHARGLQIPKQRVLVIGDQWDPVVNAFWKQQVGRVCLVTHEKSSECNACFLDLAKSECSTCVMQTHGIDQIMEHLQSSAKPVCSKLNDLA